MPKLPRGTGKASTKERAKKPAAKPAARAAASASRRRRRRTARAGKHHAAEGRRATQEEARARTARERPRRRRPSATSATARSTRHDGHAPAGPKTKLTDDQRVLLGDLFAVVEEHAGEAAEEIDRDAVERAFVFSCERHADQRRASGEDFIVHPIGVAKICAGMRLDTATLCAALLHDTVEDTSASLDEVREEFGDEIAQLVDGVTKLSGVTFQSRDDRQAENYRKMMVAMARDIRVILIKLADRLHNMRTIGSMPK